MDSGSRDRRCRASPRPAPRCTRSRDDFDFGRTRDLGFELARVKLWYAVAIGAHPPLGAAPLTAFADPEVAVSAHLGLPHDRPVLWQRMGRFTTREVAFRALRQAALPCAERHRRACGAPQGCHAHLRGHAAAQAHRGGLRWRTGGGARLTPTTSPSPPPALLQRRLGARHPIPYGVYDLARPGAARLWRSPARRAMAGCDA